MEGEYNREPDSSGEVKEAQAPSTPSLSTRGQMNMSAPLPPEPSEPPPPEPTTSEPLQSTPETKPPAAVVTDEQPAASVAAPPPPSTTETIDTTVAEKPTAPVQTLEMYERPKENPLPRPDNPETEEVSGSKEIGLGRDDGLPAATNVPVDDPTAAGRRRMQEALDPTDVSVQQNDSTVTPSTEIDNTTSASSSPLSADDSILPPVSPSLPSGASDALPSTDTPPTPQKPSSDDLIKFKTDYSTDDLGGAANEINAENADINKANRELFEARKEAERIQAETGMTMEEYLKEANLRLLHPELFVSTDPQEVMNSDIPVSPPLPATDKTNPSFNLERANDTTSLSDSSSLPTDETISIPPASPSIPGYMPSIEQEKTIGDWKNLGIINVPVADLPDPDGVNSPDDFNHHISWEDAKSAALQLPQIQKEVALGKTGDDFYAEDQAAGLDWQHGRKRVYDLYYSDTDPIQVDKDGGRYTINSGRHRIYAAKALGLETVPMLVREKYHLLNSQGGLNSNIPVNPSLYITDEINPSPKSNRKNNNIILPNSTSLPADILDSAQPISPSISNPDYTPNNEEEKLNNDLKNLGITNIHATDLPNLDELYIPGVDSINGLEKTEIGISSVTNLVPKEAVPSQAESLTPSAANDLELSSKHANLTKSTRAHAISFNENRDEIANEYFRIRSEITEDLAHYRITDGIRADPYSKGGHNFPGYDIFGSNEICSVKCFSYQQVKDKESAETKLKPRFSEYRKEFMNIISPTSESNVDAAKRLLEIKSTDLHAWEKLKSHLPSNVASSNEKISMADALSLNSTMRIPEDQLDSVKQYLTNFYYKKLVDDGVNEKAARTISKIEVNRRVLSIDPRYKTEHYQAKAAQVFFER